MKKGWKHVLLLAAAFALVLALAACSGDGEGAGGGDTPGGETSENGGNGGGEQTAAEGDAENGGGNAAEQTAEEVTLKFWTLGNTNYEALAEEYTQMHPNVKFEFQNTGDQTAHHNNLLTALSAGAGAPDIFMLEIAFVQNFIGNPDKFYNLYDLGAEEVEDIYLDWKWQQAQSVDGSFQLGLPTDIGPTVVYYRRDVLEEAGLPSDPAEFGAMIDTWDKFYDVAKEFNAKTGKTFVDTTDLLFNALRDQTQTGEIYVSKEDGSFIGDENPQVRRAYDYTVKFIQEGLVNNAVMWSPEWGEATKNGDFAVMLAPAWMKAVIADNAEGTDGLWGIAQIPEGAGNWGGSFLTLPKQGEHPEIAYDFISWLVNKENQLKSFTDSGLFPSIPDLYTDEQLTGHQEPLFGDQTIGEELAKAAERVSPVYYGPLHDSVDALAKGALRNVIEQGADPQAEWESFVEQAEALEARQ